VAAGSGWEAGEGWGLDSEAAAGWGSAAAAAMVMAEAEENDVRNCKKRRRQE